MKVDRAYAKCRHSTKEFSKIPDLNFTSFVKENSSLYHVRWVSLTKSWDCRAMRGEQHTESSVEEGALPTDRADPLVTERAQSLPLGKGETTEASVSSKMAVTVTVRALTCSFSALCTNVHVWL